MLPQPSGFTRRWGREFAARKFRQSVQPAGLDVGALRVRKSQQPIFDYRDRMPIVLTRDKMQINLGVGYLNALDGAQTQLRDYGAIDGLQSDIDVCVSLRDSGYAFLRRLHRDKTDMRQLLFNESFADTIVLGRDSISGQVTQCSRLGEGSSLDDADRLSRISGRQPIALSIDTLSKHRRDHIDLPFIERF